MDKERKLQALDESVLDTVSGGTEQACADAQVSDEIRLNLFGKEESAVVLRKSYLQTLMKLILRN